MTWADYNRYAFGRVKRSALEWEHTRLIISVLHNINVAKKSEQKKPEQILPLWIDKLGKPKKPKHKPLTKEAFEKVVQKLDKHG